MRFLSVFVGSAIPLLMFGMAAIARRAWVAGELSATDAVGLILQVLLITASAMGAVVLWRKGGGDRTREDDGQV